MRCLVVVLGLVAGVACGSRQEPPPVPPAPPQGPVAAGSATAGSGSGEGARDLAACTEVDQCTLCGPGRIVTSVDECSCLGCGGQTPVNVAHCPAITAAYMRVCGDWENANPCPQRLCAPESTEPRCVSNRCVLVPSDEP